MAWSKVLGFGLIAGGVALGCTVTTSDGDADGGATGGASSTGGATGTGGSTGGGGSTSTGGATGTGGSTAYACGTNADACVQCLNTKCCAVMQACRDNATCWGSGDNTDPGTDGELLKFHTCMSNTYTDAGTLSSSDVVGCAGSAASGGVPDNTSQDVITCLGGSGDAATSCDVECYNVDIQ